MLQFTAFFITVCAVCVCARRRFEQALAPAVCALMLLLTLLAMPRRLFWMDGVAVAALLGVAALAAYALLARRLTPRELGRRLAAYALTPGLLCFGAAVALYAYACQPMVVWWRDDVAHWALMPKSLWAYNGFLDGAHHLNPTFGGYLPGMQVLQWWVLHALGEWSEPALYATLFSCYAAFLLPLVGRMRWKRVWLAPLATAALLALPAWANSTCYAVLSVDTALAACFGYTLVRIYELNRRDGPGLLAVALGLCGLVLIKQIGVVFAVIAMVMMAVLGRCRAQGRARGAVLACAAGYAGRVAGLLPRAGSGRHAHNQPHGHAWANAPRRLRAARRRRRRGRRHRARLSQRLYRRNERYDQRARAHAAACMVRPARGAAAIALW